MLAHYFHSFQTSEKAILPTATIILLIQPLWSLFKCINIRDFLFEHFSIGFFLFFRTKKTSKVGDTEKNGKIPNKNWEKGRDRNKRENYFKKFIQWGLPCLHTKPKRRLIKSLLFCRFFFQQMTRLGIQTNDSICIYSTCCILCDRFSLINIYDVKMFWSVLCSEILIRYDIE